MEFINNKINKTERPIKLIQFGEGNFLRGFVDLMVDEANKSGLSNIGISIVKSITLGSLEQFKKQDDLYTVMLRGKQNGEVTEQTYVVDSIQDATDCYEQYEKFMDMAKLPDLRFIVSNTTEAGIVFDENDDIKLCPPNTYPAKLTKLLYERFNHFTGSKDKGLIILPVELIEQNGKKLLDCVLKFSERWKLPSEFIEWVKEDNIFCSTLVDRIITGYPKDMEQEIWQKLGYEDRLIVTGEPFALWVIESNKQDIVKSEFPLDLSGHGEVIFTQDQTPYRERKVRILNGAHTGTVLGAYLSGLNIVLECMENKTIRAFMENLVYEEIVPTVKLPMEEVTAFADSVFERFENPFIKHELLSISLNSVSKWKSRILPTLVDSYNSNGRLPKYLTFSFAALLAFYKSDKLSGTGLIGKRGDCEYLINDDKAVLEFFAESSQKPLNDFVLAVAKNNAFWGRDLTELDGFTDMVCEYLELFVEQGAEKAFATVLED